MTHYLLSVVLDTTQPEPSEAEVQRMYADVGVFNEKLKAQGSWVFAGGLHPAEHGDRRPRPGRRDDHHGRPVRGDQGAAGRLLDRRGTRPGRGAAARCRGLRVACGAPVEVRPFQDDVAS